MCWEGHIIHFTLIESRRRAWAIHCATVNAPKHSRLAP